MQEKRTGQTAQKTGKREKADQKESGEAFQFPAVIRDILTARVLEMITALDLPFSKQGMELAENMQSPDNDCR